LCFAFYPINKKYKATAVAEETFKEAPFPYIGIKVVSFSNKLQQLLKRRSEG